MKMNQSEHESTYATVGGAVLLYTSRETHQPSTHEEIARTEIARKLAALKGYPFAGEYHPAAAYSGRLYFVPNTTLTGAKQRGA